jgi:hypothetical protein
MVTTGVCTQDLVNEFLVVHTEHDAYRMALVRLIGSQKDIGPRTENYSELGEEELVAPGYPRGGFELRDCKVERTYDRAARMASIKWTFAPVAMDLRAAVAGALIYNASKGERALSTHAFGAWSTFIVSPTLIRQVLVHLEIPMGERGSLLSRGQPQGEVLWAT